MLAFVAIPSFSGTHGGVFRAAAFLDERLQASGFHVERAGNPDTPYLIGHREGASTHLLVYMMYDTRSPASTPSGSAEIRKDPDVGQVLWSPLPVGNKAATLSFLRAVQLTEAMPKRPSITVLAEGAEAVGSPGLENLVARLRETHLSGVTAGYWPRESQDQQGRSHLHLAFRGMLGIRVTASGASWGRGPTSQAIHSMFQPWVDSPAWRLVDALSMIKSAGNPDPVGSVDANWSEVAASYDVLDVLQDSGVAVPDGISSEDLLRRLHGEASPNLEFEASLSAGVGQIQPWASARLQFRPAPGHSWRKLYGHVLKTLRETGYGDVHCDVQYALDGAILDPTGPVVTALRSGYGAFAVPTVTWPVAPFTPPVSVFQTLLGIPVGIGGLGRVEKIGGGEAIRLDAGKVAGLSRQVDFYAHLLGLISAAY